MIISGTTRSAALRASRRLTLSRLSSQQPQQQQLGAIRTRYASSSSRLSLVRNSAVCSAFPYQVSSYSTERVLALRNSQFKDGAKEAKRTTLYRGEHEKENCGVGMVASLKSAPSRRVIEDADEMLVRMSHRGGCGCDPASGDGAGECIYVCCM